MGPAYLDYVAGVVLPALILKGLAQKKRAFVVALVPVFAVAHLRR